MAIERVPPRREAGAGLALPVFNKEREALLIFFRAKRGAIFRVVLPVCVGWWFVLADYLRGSLGCFPSRVLRVLLEVEGNYATLSTFSLFLFLVLLFSFSLPLFIALFMRESGAFFMGEKLLSWLFGSMRGAIYATLSRGARGSGAFGGACITGAFLYPFLMGRATHPLLRSLCDNRTD